jgi:hypothetical protein
MPTGDIDKARDASEMTNKHVGVATNSEGLDHHHNDHVGGHDDGSYAMMLKDLFHGMRYHRVCTKQRDDGIRTDEERRGFAYDGLLLENKPRGNVGMHGLNGMETAFNS